MQGDALLGRSMLRLDCLVLPRGDSCRVDGGLSYCACFVKKVRRARGCERETGAETGRVGEVGGVLGSGAVGHVLDATSYDASEHVLDGRATEQSKARQLGVMQCRRTLQVTRHQVVLFFEALSPVRREKGRSDAGVDTVCACDSIRAHVWAG